MHHLNKSRQKRGNAQRKKNNAWFLRNYWLKVVCLFFISIKAKNFYYATKIKRRQKGGFKLFKTICEHKKKLTSTLLVLFVAMIMVVGYTGFVSASGSSPLWGDMQQVGGDEGLGSSIAPSAGGGDEAAGEVIGKIENQVTSMIVTIRVLAAIAAVIFVIWIGIIFFTSGGNPMKLAAAKTQIGLFFAALVLIFAAEPIVRFILSWFVGDN